MRNPPHDGSSDEKGARQRLLNILRFIARHMIREIAREQCYVDRVINSSSSTDDYSLPMQCSNAHRNSDSGTSKCSRDRGGQPPTGPRPAGPRK